MLSIDQNKLEDVLVKLNLLTKEQLDQAKIESVRSATDLDDVILKMRFLPEEDLVKAKAISINVPYVNLTELRVDPNVIRFIPKEMAKKFQAVAFGQTGTTLNVAMINPNNVQAIEFIERKSGLRVTSYMASPKGIENIIGQYQDLSAEVNAALANVDVLDAPTMSDAKEDRTQKIGEISQDAPVTRAVNTILEYAAKSKASDIHIEPWENSLKVRFRVDGILQETMSLPSHIQSALVSRIKILSDLKIDEHRVPQDGSFDIDIEGHEIDIRVAVSPTVHGEKIVLRLLDKSGGIISLESLGIVGRAFTLISESVKKPHGMLLATGPTGSGKSTSLYALLTKMNSSEVNIVTLEDPVEYQVAGVNQIQINPAVGLTFASGLRSILRQDPDIIMVGEIRDAETADLAIQSALTGHTVLSTIHTNNSAGVLPRLLDMDIEPFLIASTVTTVIGQRLVRKLCPKCKQAVPASVSLQQAIEKTLGPVLPKTAEQAKLMGYEKIPAFGTKQFTVYKAVGCEQCNNTGYSGRIGIYEVFNMTPELEKLVVAHATTYEIQKQTLTEGMLNMRQDGFLKALNGITTVEEVIAKASEE